MEERKSLSSYSFYVSDEIIDRVDKDDEISRSEAARIALEDFVNDRYGEI